MDTQSNGDLSTCVHDVYRVTTCRPGRGHKVAAARLQLVISNINCVDVLSVCGEGGWTCFNRQCLTGRHQLCDGVDDCSDGSDESYAHARCPGLSLSLYDINSALLILCALVLIVVYQLPRAAPGL